MTMLHLLTISLVLILVLSFVVGKLFRTVNPVNEERAARNFLRCFPEETIKEILIDTEQKLAVLALENSLGLACQPQDRIVCRVLSSAHQIYFNKHSKVIINMNDFTFPHISANFTPDQISRLETWVHDAEKKGAVDAT